MTFITLKGKDIRFCKGCQFCQLHKACIIKDDVPPIIDMIRKTDILVFATPIYFYELSGQLKTLLDRCDPLYPQEYRFREVYLVTSSAEDGDAVYQTPVGAIKGWIDCFPKSRFAGIYSGGGASLKDIGNDSSFRKMLDGAFEFGRRM